MNQKDWVNLTVQFNKQRCKKNWDNNFWSICDISFKDRKLPVKFKVWWFEDRRNQKYDQGVAEVAAGYV